jgi:hypothetical protein
MVVVKGGYSEYPLLKGANPESIVGREGRVIRGDQPRAICIVPGNKNIDQPTYLYNHRLDPMQLVVIQMC